MENNTSSIFQSISENGQRYVEEKIGRLLNAAMKHYIVEGKKSGDYHKFCSDNGLKEEKTYQFMKADDEPSSPQTLVDLDTAFEPKHTEINTFDFDLNSKHNTDFIKMLVNVRTKDAEESKTATETKVVPTQKYLKTKRKAVFSNPAEVLDQDSSFVPPKYEKSESEKEKIKNALMNNMLTKKLSDESINTLIDAMQKRAYNKDDVLIQYGDDGSEYFVLDSGDLECKVYDQDTGDIIVTKAIQEGSGFGELALLYQTPRSATITATSDCIAWVLDQMTFKTVIMSSAIKERNTRLSFVDKINFFSEYQDV